MHLLAALSPVSSAEPDALRHALHYCRYSPFEALRIRIISAGEDPGVISSLKQAILSEQGPSQLFTATLPLIFIEASRTMPPHNHPARAAVLVWVGG